MSDNLRLHLESDIKWLRDQLSTLPESAVLTRRSCEARLDETLDELAALKRAEQQKGGEG